MKNIILDPNGDVLVIPSDYVNPVPILVSSAAMRQGSATLRQMFNISEALANTPSTEHLPQVKMPHDSDAIILLCKIFHQSTDLPEEVDVYTLEGFGMLCDRYSCVQQVRAWSKLWAGNIIRKRGLPATRI